MPWSVKDVDKHKKGLDAKQKKQWVEVANSVLSKCLENGGDESSCAASAIRQANGVVDNKQVSIMEVKRNELGMTVPEFYAIPRDPPGDSKLPIYDAAHVKNALIRLEHLTDVTDEEKVVAKENILNAAMKMKIEISDKGEYIVVGNKSEGDYSIKKRKFGGKDTIIVPVTMMVEGVHSGSMGAIYHSIEELGKFPESWNGIPVVIDHPKNKKGEGISANSPEVLEEGLIGRVYNSFVKDKTLKGEVWFDEEILSNSFPEVLERIKNGEVLEVSVGVFTDLEEEEGEWNGEEYIGIAVNHRPDHLAILPDSVGACSNFDGCGLGVNEETKKELSKITKFLSNNGIQLKEVLIHKEVKKNVGFRQIMDQLYSILSAKNGKDDGSYYYLEEVYPDRIIFSMSSKTGNKLYQQDYSLEGGEVKLTGYPAEVSRKVEYIVVNKMSRTTLPKKEVIMSKDCVPCQAKINALIANKDGKWKETDREFLETLTEEQLDKVVPTVVEKVVEKEVQVNALTDSQKAALTYGERLLKEKREKLIREIQENTSKEVWPDAILSPMTDDMLERVHGSIPKKEVDYSFQGGGPVSNASEVEALYPAGVEVQTK